MDYELPSVLHPHISALKGRQKITNSIWIIFFAYKYFKSDDQHFENLLKWHIYAGYNHLAQQQSIIASPKG